MNQAAACPPPPGTVFEQRLAHPGFGMAMALCLVVISVQSVLATPLAILDLVAEQALHRSPPHLAGNAWALGCINLIAFGGAIALGLYLNRLPFRRAFPLSRITPIQFAALALALLGTDILLSEVDDVLRTYLPIPDLIMRMFSGLFYTREAIVSRVFLLVLVAPLTEELLFRGVILRGLLSRYRPWPAVLLTALLFAAVHLNPWQFLSALGLGIVFGWVYLRSGSVAFCVVSHGLANGFSVLVMSLPFRIPGLNGAPDASALEFQPWWLDLSGLVLLVAGTFLFRRVTVPPGGDSV